MILFLNLSEIITSHCWVNNRTACITQLSTTDEGCSIIPPMLIFSFNAKSFYLILKPWDYQYLTKNWELHIIWQLTLKLWLTIWNNNNTCNLELCKHQMENKIFKLFILNHDHALSKVNSSIMVSNCLATKQFSILSNISHQKTEKVQ